MNDLLHDTLLSVAIGVAEWVQFLHQGWLPSSSVGAGVVRSRSVAIIFAISAASAVTFARNVSVNTTSAVSAKGVLLNSATTTQAGTLRVTC
jgi:hypothetical protein